MSMYLNSVCVLIKTAADQWVFSSHHLEEIVFLIHPQILLHSRFANQSVLGRNRGIEDAKSKKDEGEHVSTIFRDCHDYGLTNL